MNKEKLIESVKRGEGCKLRSYQDTAGVWTIGYGHNLQVIRINQSLADEWLLDDINSAAIAASMFPEWQFLDTEARQNAFIEMVFNLGPTRLSFFKAMLAAIRAQDWTTVAKEALDSKWATQVGQRAIRLIAMLQTGQFQE